MDISFKTEEGRFNFRVSAYITCGDKMLLQETKGQDFYNLVGGRVHLGESTKDAIKREIKEELGVCVKNPKLFEITENFFDWQGLKVHELGFFYHVELAKKYLKTLEHLPILDHADKQTAFWVDKKDIKKYNCKPEFIYKFTSSDLSQIHHNERREN